MHPLRQWAMGWWLLLGAVLLLPGRGQIACAATTAPAHETSTGETLRFSLIDQLPSQAGVTAINSIEERRRLATFGAALQDMVREGKLGPSVLINDEVALRSGTGSEKPQPPGTIVIRIFLTQWSQTLLGGTADTEILCRFSVEKVRNGRRIARPGTFSGRARYEIAFAPQYRDNLAAYQAAARKALEQLVPVL